MISLPESSATPPPGGLPTRRAVVVDGPHPPVELLPVAARWNLVGPHRPCPPRAPSIGIWRSLTDNNGRLQEDLTCGIGVASDQDDETGRAFQARDRWATPGPHPGHDRPDRSGQPRSPAAHHLPRSLCTRPPRPPQVAATLLGSLTRKSATVRRLPRITVGSSGHSDLVRAVFLWRRPDRPPSERDPRWTASGGCRCGG